ncbi:MAG: multiheme c-type cytochrome [Betaproteobacteria bacterium]
MAPRWPARSIGAGIVFLASAVVWAGGQEAVRPKPAAPSEAPRAPSAFRYVGSQACEDCHLTEYKSWRSTLHVQMTKPIAQARIVGDFRPGTHLEAYGRAYRMDTHDGRYFITISKNGRPPEKFEINYTLGARRFQGYLSKQPDGRIYVLPVFWHNVTKRWIDWKEITPIPDDPDHDLRQIWNVTCVNCHATNLVKNYDIATNTYATTWTEMGISCEACHGPGAPHVALMNEWANNPASKPAYDSSDRNHELSAILKIFSPRTAAPRQVFDTCGYCHGNKNNVFFGFTPGGHYEDFALPFLISEPIPDNDPQGDFWPDGRPSRFDRPQAIMLTGCFQRGEVTCTSCHRMHGANNDHALKVPVEDGHGGHTKQSDLLCTQCHAVGAKAAGGDLSHPPAPATGYGATAVAPTTFPDITAHTHHQADSQGSRCINCHMSNVNWRLITRRLDHTFSPPVPEMTAKFGVPDACTTCHEDKTPEWASTVMDSWYGNGAKRRAIVEMADVVYRAGTGDVTVLPQIARLAVDRSHGALIRASAAEFAGQLMGKETVAQRSSPAVVNALIGAAADPEPIVRSTAVRALGLVREREVLPAIAAHLTDPVRVVRVSAARALMAEGVTALDGPAGAALAHAQDEWMESLRTFNDVSDDQASLGWLEAERGHSEEAAKDLKNAVTIDPTNARPHVYLGVLAARAGLYDEALKHFKNAKTLAPNYQNLDRLIEEARKRATIRY